MEEWGISKGTKLAERGQGQWCYAFHGTHALGALRVLQRGVRGGLCGTGGAKAPAFFSTDRRCTADSYPQALWSQGWVSVPFRSGWAGAAGASFPSHTKRSSNTNGVRSSPRGTASRQKAAWRKTVLAVFVMKRLGLRARFSLLLERWGVCCVGPNPNLNHT